MYCILIHNLLNNIIKTIYVVPYKILWINNNNINKEQNYLSNWKKLAKYF